MIDELRAHRLPKPSQIYLVATSDELIRAFEEALRNAINPM